MIKIPPRSLGSLIEIIGSHRSWDFKQAYLLDKQIFTVFLLNSFVPMYSSQKLHRSLIQTVLCTYLKLLEKYVLYYYEILNTFDRQVCISIHGYKEHSHRSSLSCKVYDYLHQKCVFDHL